MKTKLKQQKRKLRASFFMALLFLMVLVLSRPALSQVTISGNWGTGTTHTAEPGYNRALIFFAHAEHPSGTVTLNSVTYGSQPMTKIIDQVVGTGYTANVTAFILDEAGIATASNDTFVPVWIPRPAPLYIPAYSLRMLTRRV